MSTISHPPTGTVSERGWTVLLHARDMWASLAIFAMWIAVAVASVWVPMPSLQSTTATAPTIPTGVFVALFASIGTWAIPKHVFHRSDTYYRRKRAPNRSKDPFLRGCGFHERRRPRNLWQ